VIYQLALFACVAVLSVVSVGAQEHAQPTGYTDTPFLPGGKWRVHDDARPRPAVVTPGTFPTQDRRGAAPSDAVVLFDGKDLSQWVGWQGPFGLEFYPSYSTGKVVEPTWKVENGYVEVAGPANLMSKQKFGDIQLHVEWAAPALVSGSSQGRGNSGIGIMGTYEIQVLDSFDNKSYADGQAAAIYGEYPPLVNASRAPGQWQTYDIVFEAPRFTDGKLVKPAYATIFHNGVLVQNHQELLGPTGHRVRSEYVPHEAEGPLLLQMHNNPVRYRNVWVRRLNLDEKP
jgi:3-keto-disaccharide hydrolase